MKDDEIEVAVQINGKTRAVISISADSSKEDAIAAGREAVKEKLDGQCGEGDLRAWKDCQYCM